MEEELQKCLSECPVNYKKICDICLYWEYNITAIPLKIQQIKKDYDKNAKNGYYLYFLGMLYYRGAQDLEKDIDTAIEFLKQAVELNNTGAMILLAEIRRTEGKFSETVRLLNKAVDMKSSAALNALACLYVNGCGVEKNYEQAIKLYKAGIELNNPESMNILASWYINKQMEHISKSVELYKKAIELNYTPAMVNYASIMCKYNYLSGMKDYDYISSLFNYPQAILLLERAIKLNNNIHAMRDLAKMYKKGYGVAIDNKKASELYQKVIKFYEENNQIEEIVLYPSEELTIYIKNKINTEKELKEELKNVKKVLNDIETHVASKPGGTLFKEARSHYKDLCLKNIKMS
jgi:hypothetical protein